MMLLRLLRPQGIAGIAASLCLALLLVVQKGETRHWKKQSSAFERQYHEEQAAFARTVADYRAAAAAAHAADRANVARINAEQQAINERTENDFKARLTAARSSAERLRSQANDAPADPGRGGAAPMPGLPVAARRAVAPTGENRLPAEDALTATEQAIQLDELIEWVRRQHSVDPNEIARAQHEVDSQQP
jgi:hypothetical protein